MRLLFLSFFLIGCSANFHLRQAEIHLRKAALLGAKIERDTVYVEREVLVPSIHFDTVVREVNFLDTVVVTKNNIITKIKINTVEKEVYIKTVCPPDTVRIEVPVTVKEKIESGWPWWWLLVAGLGGLVVGVIMGKLI